LTRCTPPSAFSPTHSHVFLILPLDSPCDLRRCPPVIFCVPLLMFSHARSPRPECPFLVFFFDLGVFFFFFSFCVSHECEPLTYCELTASIARTFFLQPSPRKIGLVGAFFHKLPIQSCYFFSFFRCLPFFCELHSFDFANHLLSCRMSRCPFFLHFLKPCSAFLLSTPDISFAFLPENIELSELVQNLFHSRPRPAPDRKLGRPLHSPPSRVLSYQALIWTSYTSHAVSLTDSCCYNVYSVRAPLC